MDMTRGRERGGGRGEAEAETEAGKEVHQQQSKAAKAARKSEFHGDGVCATSFVQQQRPPP